MKKLLVTFSLGLSECDPLSTWLEASVFLGERGKVTVVSRRNARESHAQCLTFETGFCVASQTCLGKIFSIISSPRLAYEEPSLGATVLGDVPVWTRLLVPAGCAACCSGTRERGDCGFQTRFLVTHSKKFILHFNQSTHTHTHIVKTSFREQFLALLNVVFSLLKFCLFGKCWL